MSNNLIAKTSTLINTPRENIWDALVNPEAIQQYMFGTHVVSDWREGSPIVWKGEWQGKPYEDKGVILQFKPEHVLQYSHFSPLSGMPDRPENYHTVTIELSAEGNQTRVSLTQDHNASEEERAHSEKNWEMMLTALKKFLEQERKAYVDNTRTEAASPSTPVQSSARARLEALVGEWDLVASSGGRPLGRGRTVFEWREGGAFLAQRSQVEQSDVPSATMLIGLDDSTGIFSMLYHDSRGISRVYQMSFDDSTWKIWRHAPGFSQRFIGKLDDGGRVIQGSWEISSDGSNWKHDFELTYTKVV